MPKTSQKGEPRVIDKKESDDKALLDECVQHESDSYKSLSSIRETWDDKESMLINKLEDNLSTSTKSQVYNPVLSSIVWERGSRVMAQPATGKAWAVSKNDLGKNMLMNLALKYFVNNANEEYTFLLKNRFMDIYSNVYGSFFGLVPWRVNKKEGYIGPELSLINIRDVRPQPGRRSPDSSDYFTVRSEVSSAWLEAQDPKIWKMENVKAAIEQAKQGGESKKDSSGRENRSLIEREMWPNEQSGEKKFPKIELFTEYRGDQWITWTPQLMDVKESRPYLLRNIDPDYPDQKLPVIVKHAFPLIDSMIGLGEFERGKTLQFAINSLINLYLDGVKYSIFPPLHINLNEVTAKSIKWAPGSKWYMNKPNVDVQIMNMRSGDWLNTFQSTYGFMSSAIYNLAGSQPGTLIEGTDFTEGKTPEAIKARQFKQSARDEWDRFMMEQTIQAMMERWIGLISTKMDVPLTARIFEPEIKEIKARFPDEKGLLEVFESGKRGNITFDRRKLNDSAKEPTRYDYEIEEGSTMSRSMADEGQVATEVLAEIGKVPALLAEIRSKGGDINILELYKRRLIGAGIRDWDRIVIEPEDTTSTPDGEVTVGGGGAANAAAQAIVPTEAEAAVQAQVAQEQPQPQVEVPQFRDPEVAAIASRVFGDRVGSIPAQ